MYALTVFFLFSSLNTNGITSESMFVRIEMFELLIYFVKVMATAESKHREDFKFSLVHKSSINGLLILMLS